MRELSKIFHTLLSDYMEHRGVDEAGARRRFQAAEVTAKKRWLELKPETAADKTRFYREADYYIADLTGWILRDKAVASFIPLLRGYLGKCGIGTVLDYGCGIGTQGLSLVEAGADVTLMDIEGPVWDYAKWRAEKHGFLSKTRWLPIAPVMDSYDLILCIDVIGHVPDPFRLLRELSDKARYLFFNVDFRVHKKAEMDRYPQHHQEPEGWTAELNKRFVNCDRFLWRNVR